MVITIQKPSYKASCKSLISLWCHKTIYIEPLLLEMPTTKEEKTLEQLKQSWK